MASAAQFAIPVVVALCLLSLPGSFAANHRTTVYSEFFVEGDVFCEVCRVNFINRLSEAMAGAKVKLVCRGEEPTNITYTKEGETDAMGHYQIKVEGDHETEECAVTLVKSGRTDCDEMLDEGWANKPTSMVTLTNENGFHGHVRHANPLGFIKKEAAPKCAELVKELQLNDLDL